MAQSTKSRKSSKVAKPYRGFPLTPHPSGSWVKKINGTQHYFGGLSDPDAALERFNREWPFLKEGRTPPPVSQGTGCTVKGLCDAFLDSKNDRVESGELSPRTFRDYRIICQLLTKYLGRQRRIDDLRPDDFKELRARMARTWGHVRLANEINRARVVFKFAFDEGLIERPIRYGQSFDQPSKKTLRVARRDAGKRLFDAAEILRILDALDGKEIDVDDAKKSITADPVLKAIVLLGINCAFGNSDIASLPIAAININRGWIEFPRPKTGIERRAPLWPETIAALRTAIRLRPEPTDPADLGLAFLTRCGKRWTRVQASADKEDGQRPSSVALDALCPRFVRILKTLHINGRRGLGFYTLRHTFETVAGESKDQVAVDAMMGHVDETTAAAYREGISDARLMAIVNCVHAWLFA